MSLNCVAVLSALVIAAATVEPTALPAPPEGTYPGEVLTDRPVAYWRLGETSGTTATDLSGNRNDAGYHDGVTLGLPGLLSGDSDPAVGVGGLNNGYIQSNTSFLTTTTGITVEVWFVANSFDGRQTLVLTGFTSPSIGYHWLYLNHAVASSDLCWEYADGTTNPTQCIPFAPLIGQRYHLVVTHDYLAKQINFYINGSRYPHAAVTHTDNVVPLSNQFVRLGAYDSRYHFAGTLGEVAIYSQILSPTRIQSHSTAGGSTTLTDIYVAPPPTGNNQSDGSSAHPLATVQYAADAVLPGVTVHVAPGIYPGALVSRIGGTLTAHVKFVSDSKWQAKVKSDGATATWTNKAQYVDIQGFDVSGTNFPVGQPVTGILTLAPHVRIIGNHIHNIGETFCPPSGGSGIGADWNVDSIGNMIDHIGQLDPPCIGVHGIYYSEPQGGKIQNNICYLTSGWGIHLWHNPRDIVIANNLVFENRHGGIVVGGDPSEGGVADGILVTNNIAIHNGGAGSGYGWGIVEEGSTGPNNEYMNNLVYANVAGGIDLEYVADVGTLTTDPQLVDYQPDGSGDYHLSAGSPAIDSGVSDGAPAYDFEGTERPLGLGYDRGPYEKRPAVSADPFVQANSGFTSGGFVSSFALSFNSNVTAGDTLIVMVQSTVSGGGTLAISDNQGNTWTQRQTINTAIGPNTVWDAINSNGGATTITITNPGGTLLGSISIMECANITAFDTQAINTRGSSTTQTTTSITLAQTNEVVLGWFAMNFVTGQTFSAGSGYTLRTSTVGNINTGSEAVEEGLQSGATATASMTFGSAVSGTVGILAWKANP